MGYFISGRNMRDVTKKSLKAKNFGPSFIWASAIVTFLKEARFSRAVNKPCSKLSGLNQAKNHRNAQYLD